MTTKAGGETRLAAGPAPDATMDQFEALLAGPAPSGSRTLADRLALGLGAVVAWAFIAAILISVYEVAMRYLFNQPSAWANPTTTTLCQIGFAFGGAWCMARREHIRISFVPDKLGPKARWTVELVALLVGLVYLGGLSYAVYLDAANAIWRFDFQGNWSPERTPGPPNWPLPALGKAALLCGAVLFLLVLLNHLARHLRPGRG